MTVKGAERASEFSVCCTVRGAGSGKRVSGVGAV